jgi:hypothetical protein
MSLEQLYLKRWAERIIERAGMATLLALGRRGRDRHVADMLRALGAERHEIEAIIEQVNVMVRDQARPADAPAARGRARMFR